MIPEDKHVAVCGIVLLCPSDEVRKRLLFRHAQGGIQIPDLLYFAVLHRIAGVRAVLHAVRVQALRRSDLQDDGHVLSLLRGLPDLFNIDRGKAPLGLQVRGDHILHDDHILIRGVIGIEIVPGALRLCRLDRRRVHHIRTAHHISLLRHIADFLIVVFDQIFHNGSGRILPDRQQADDKYQCQELRCRKQENRAV